VSGKLTSATSQALHQQYSVETLLTGTRIRVRSEWPGPGKISEQIPGVVGAQGFEPWTR
jgi:hypothetical protein